MIRFMRRVKTLLTVLLLLGATAPSAQTVLNADAFDRYTQGKTLFYGSGGQAYGVERYLPGRRVVWSFLDGRCQDGEWYPQGDQICFVYDQVPDPQCWRFSLGANGLVAQFENEDRLTELYESADVDEDMVCMGPDVGV